MKYSQNVQKLVFLVIVSILVVSCNSDGPEIEQPEKIYYDLAQKRMENKNFIGAIESLEAIESKYPFGRYAEQAQVELMPNFGLYFKSDLSSQNSQRIKMRSNIQTQNTSRGLSPKWKRDE